MGRVREWSDLLAPPIMPREGELDFSLHPWLCSEQPLKELDFFL